MPSTSPRANFAGLGMESPGGGGRPVSPPIAGLPGGMPRQRGFYSEPLDAGMPAEELEAIASESAAGPRTAKLQPSTARQAVPKASLFRGRGTEARADVGRRAHAALEAANEVRAIFSERPLHPQHIPRALARAAAALTHHHHHRRPTCRSGRSNQRCSCRSRRGRGGRRGGS